MNDTDMSSSVLAVLGDVGRNSQTDVGGHPRPRGCTDAVVEMVGVDSQKIALTAAGQNATAKKG
jgi:hypothetical protein